MGGDRKCHDCGHSFAQHTGCNARCIGESNQCDCKAFVAVPAPDARETRERHPVGGKGDWREQTFAALVDALRYGALEVPLLAEMLSYPGATKPDVGDQILWCANTLLATPSVAPEVSEAMPFTEEMLRRAYNKARPVTTRCFDELHERDVWNAQKFAECVIEEYRATPPAQGETT